MAAEVPLKVVDWKGFESVKRFAGPRPLPLTTKMLPGAIDPLGNAEGVLLAAFATLVMAGAAESRDTAAKSRRINEDGRNRNLYVVFQIMKWPREVLFLGYIVY